MPLNNTELFFLAMCECTLRKIANTQIRCPQLGQLKRLILYLSWNSTDRYYLKIAYAVITQKCAQYPVRYSVLDSAFSGYEINFRQKSFQMSVRSVRYNTSTSIC